MEDGHCGCERCRSSKHNRHGPRILFGVEPIAGESLVGLIARSCAASHMPHIASIVREATDVAHAHVNLARRTDLDFDQLAWAARLASHDVETRRYRSAPITPMLPGVRFHHATIPTYDLALKTKRIALSWLDGVAHHCALGHHALVPHCPSSGELLIDRCPRCGTRFTWTSSDLVHCSECHVDLRTLARDRVSKGKLRSTAMMANLLHPDPKRHSLAVRDLPAELADMDRGVVFELGWRLGSVLAGVGPGGRDRAKRLPSDIRLAIMETGSELLRGWPESIRDAFTETASRDCRNGVELANALRNVLRARGGWPQHRPLLLQALPGLAATNACAVTRTLPHAANAADTQRVLGVGQRTFERIRAAGHLTVLREAGTKNRHDIFDASQFDRVATMLSDCIAFSSIAQRLGVSRHGVEQLCALGYLLPLDENIVGSARIDRQARRSSFDDLLDAIQSNRSIEIPSSAVPLRRAVMTFGGREKPWGPIIRAMVRGDLAFQIHPGRAPLIHTITVAAADIPAIAELTFSAPRHCDISFSEQVNGRDAEEILNINPRGFQQALADGEIGRSVNGTYDRRKIIALAKHYVSGGEILMRWGAGTRHLPAPFRGQGRLRRQCSLGWRRHDAEAAMA